MTSAAWFLVVLAVSFGQARGGGNQTPQAPQGQTGNAPAGGARQPNATGQPNAPNAPASDELPRTIFLSGSVRLSDGSIPPTSVVIERVCGGTVRPEAYTDSRGNFSFIVGSRNSAVIADASTNNDSFPRGTGSSRSAFDAGLTGCEIRANLAGFLSDSIILSFRGALDDPEIGTIHLHRIANVDGYTFSITSGLAPKNARNAYEKGLNDVKKQKWADAQRDFKTAVDAYPQYAIAWYELGRVYQEQKNLDEAKRAHEEAVKIDPKYINPYGQLAVIAVNKQNWADVVRYTSQVIKLNPFVAPEIYFYGAVGNFNMKDMAAAESRAREAAKRDEQHKIPRINHLLALILAAKQDYKEAAENMRLYLQLSPKASDAAQVKEQLAEWEKEEK